MIWRKQGTSLNRLLCFNDVMFTRHGVGFQSSLAPLSSLSYEEKLTPLNSFYISTQISPRILAKQSKTTKKCLHFTIISLLFNLVKIMFVYEAWVKQPDRIGAFQNLNHLNAMVTQHNSAVWPVPYAYAQPYHPGSGSHGQLFRPC